MAGTTSDSILTSSATLAADLVPLFIKERTLMISERQYIFYQFGDKEALPEGQGKTIQFTRYERLALPTVPLTEGVTPTAVPLTTAVVQAIVDQWGSVVTLSDVGILTVRHPVLREANSRIATQHTETVDREVQNVLAGGTNVTFANARTARANLVAGDVPTTDLIRQIVANLRAQGAPTLEGGHYVGCLDPFLEMDLTKDATFVNAASYSNIRALYNGEVGMWMGVRWVRSNFIPIITYLQTGADTTPTFTSSSVAAVGGLTGFAAANVVWQISKLDPQSGQEVFLSKANTQAITATQVLSINSTANTLPGTYNLYVSLLGSTIPVYQVTFTLTSAPGAVTTLIAVGASGTQSLPAGGPGAGALQWQVVDQGLGQVAPPAPPQVGSAGGPNVHTGYVFGREAFGVVDLGGLTTTLTPATATDSDPLIQRRKIGWKQLFKAVIKNPNFYQRFETLSAFN